MLVPGSICMPVRYGFANWDDGKYMTPEQLAWMFPPGCPEELVPFFDLLREEGCEEV